MEKRYPQAIMATALLPWDENYEFMPDVFERQVEHLIDNGISSIYLFGTAGEGYAVNNRQFTAIVKQFSELMKSDALFPMVGLIDLSVPRMIEKLEIAYSYGIRDFQFSLPNWGALNDDEVFDFFDALLPKYPDCRFLNYNLKRTRRFLEPEELFKLAELHPNFAAVKYTRGGQSDFAAIAESKSPLQFFVTESNFMELSKLTECGLLMSIGNIDLVKTSKFVNDCISGNHTGAALYLNKLELIREEMKKSMTYPVIDGAYDKMYSKYNLSDFPLRLLPPYQSASADIFKKFTKTATALL